MAKREAKQFRQVYFIEAVDVGLVKIGCANDARARLRELQVGSPCKLELKGVYHVDDAHGLEAGYHNRYAHLHSHGEWLLPRCRLVAGDRDLVQRGTRRLQSFGTTLLDLQRPPIQLAETNPPQPFPYTMPSYARQTLT